MATDQDELKLPDLKVIDWILLIVVIIVLFAAGYLLCQSLKSQDTAYGKVIDHAIKISTANGTTNGEANAAVLAFSRARDFANMKAASMLVGFLLIFTGALFLLKVFSLAYKLSAGKTPAGSFGLESSSPGLVMITLGVAIMIVVLVTKTAVNYKEEAKPDLKAAFQKLDSLQTLLNAASKPILTTPKAVKLKSAELADSTFLADGEITDGQINQLASRLKADPSLKIRLTPRLGGQSAARGFKVAMDMIEKIKMLLVRAGINAQRVEVTSYGETPPRAANTSKSGVILVIKK